MRLKLLNDHYIFSSRKQNCSQNVKIIKNEVSLQQCFSILFQVHIFSVTVSAGRTTRRIKGCLAVKFGCRKIRELPKQTDDIRRINRFLLLDSFFFKFDSENHRYEWRFRVSYRYLNVEFKKKNITSGVWFRAKNGSCFCHIYLGQLPEYHIHSCIYSSDAVNMSSSWEWILEQDCRDVCDINNCHFRLYSANDIPLYSFLIISGMKIKIFVCWFLQSQKYLVILQIEAF